MALAEEKQAKAEAKQLEESLREMEAALKAEAAKAAAAQARAEEMSRTNEALLARLAELEASVAGASKTKPPLAAGVAAWHWLGRGDWRRRRRRGLNCASRCGVACRVVVGVDRGLVHD